MPGPVTFDYSAWSARYPELSTSVNSSLAATYFAEASIYIDNTAASPVQDPNVLLTLLNMATAHIAAMNAALNGQPASPLVGRISQAAEGSVNVQVQFDMPPGSAQWWSQTKYGAACWAAMAPYRMGTYIPACPRVMDPWAPVFVQQ